MHSIARFRLHCKLYIVIPLYIMSTEIYDEMERQVGITAYLSKEHTGFAAVLKARISDFVVHEGTSNSWQFTDRQSMAVLLVESQHVFTHTPSSVVFHGVTFVSSQPRRPHRTTGESRCPRRGGARTEKTKA